MSPSSEFLQSLAQNSDLVLTATRGHYDNSVSISFTIETPGLGT